MSDSEDELGDEEGHYRDPLCHEGMNDVPTAFDPVLTHPAPVVPVWNREVRAENKEERRGEGELAGEGALVAAPFYGAPVASVLAPLNGAPVASVLAPLNGAPVAAVLAPFNGAPVAFRSEPINGSPDPSILAPLHAEMQQHLSVKKQDFKFKKSQHQATQADMLRLVEENQILKQRLTTTQDSLDAKKSAYEALQKSHKQAQTKMMDLVNQAINHTASEDKVLLSLVLNNFQKQAQ